jgi:hypothetical protein
VPIGDKFELLELIRHVVDASLEQMSSLPGDPDTPTALIASLPTLIGGAPGKKGRGDDPLPQPHWLHASNIRSNKCQDAVRILQRLPSPAVTAHALRR